MFFLNKQMASYCAANEVKIKKINWKFSSLNMFTIN